MNDDSSRQPTNIAPSRAVGLSPVAPPRSDAPPPPPGAAPAAPPTGRGTAAVSGLRFAIAMAVAVLADTVGLPFGEVGVFVFDLFVGLILALCLRGLRPEIIVACLIEAIPGIGLFPTWSLAVPALWTRMKLGRAADAPQGPPSTKG